MSLFCIWDRRTGCPKHNRTRQRQRGKRKSNTSEIYIDINNIWSKHVFRQKTNDDTKHKDEREHHEKARESWLSLTARNNNYSDDESCTYANTLSSEGRNSRQTVSGKTDLTCVRCQTKGEVFRAPCSQPTLDMTEYVISLLPPCSFCSVLEATCAWPLLKLSFHWSNRQEHEIAGTALVVWIKWPFGLCGINC